MSIGSPHALMPTGSTGPPDTFHRVSPMMPGTTDIIQSATPLLEAQTMMMAVNHRPWQAAHTVPPLNEFTGEDVHSVDSSFERWIEGFDKRAETMGWKENNV